MTRSYPSSYRLFLSILLLLCAFGCTVPYAFDEKAFENVLIVDGTLSNQMKKHKIFLSRSYAFDGEPEGEKNAMVYVKSDQGERFDFVVQKGGYYESELAFSAQANVSYTLFIESQEGQTYRSTPMTLPETSNITNVYAAATENDRDEPGIGIYLDASSESNAARLYRFEYEETYKIIAPYWTPYDAVVVFEGYSTFATDVILRETEEQTCYGTDYSNRILLRSTLNQTEDRLEKELIRFIPITDSKLQYRYSILVRLLVESPQAYSYFETLKDLSVTSSAFFTEKQPGYIAGNISNLEDPFEKVGGFFRVAAVAEKRIFFSLEDFYPEAPQPDYFISCIQLAPTAEGTRGNRNLLNTIYSAYGRFYQYNTGEMPGGPYIFVNAPCGDCTVLGSNRKPDFWNP